MISVFPGLVIVIDTKAESKRRRNERKRAKERWEKEKIVHAYDDRGGVMTYFIV